MMRGGSKDVHLQHMDTQMSLLGTPTALHNYAAAGGGKTAWLVARKKEERNAKYQSHSNSTISTDREKSNVSGILNILWDPTCLLLVCFPFGALSYFWECGDIPTFWLNFFAMVPLAKILGDATEELAAGLKNDTVGGLLNATFGNAVEMILTVQTLRAGQIEVVKGTLLGSILSNLLLVLGMSFFIGGLVKGADGKVKGKQQVFSSNAALTNMTMLFLATCAFALPTVFFQRATSEYRDEESEISSDRLDIYIHGSSPLLLKVSRWCSIYILVAYLAFLLFQLYTHVDVFQAGDAGDVDGDGKEDEEEEAQISPCAAVVLLLVTTCFVAAASEWLVDSIEGLVKEWRMGKNFIGIILLPIVGNACEHAGAVRMAIYDKVDITIGIAVGSSTQIALFVVPFAVLVGWAIGQPMDLNLHALETTVLMFSVLITFSVLSDGASNWFEGFMLVTTYAVIATLFWFIPSDLAA